MTDNAPQDRQSRFSAIYASGQMPWGAAEPPPEVMTLVADLSPGKALDLGCGYGRTAIYLAQQGWQVDGIDFVPEAIAEAKKRAEIAQASDQIQFWAASVADLHFLEDEYDAAFDVGCLHALPENEMRQYRDELLRLLRPGAVYLLFIRLKEDGENEEQGSPHVPDHMIDTLFGDGFVQERVAYGLTNGSGDSPWRSAWFWFRRK